MNLVVLDGYCLNPGDLSWSAIESLANVTVHDRTPVSLIAERIAGAELVLTNKTPLRRDVLEQSKSLRYIGVLATGYNIVDVDAAKELGIAVTNIPTYGTDSVAQFAFALLLELCHHVGAHSDSVRQGGWSRSSDWSYAKSPLAELAGKTMGIIGFGRIGRQTAKIADALGMRVLASDEVETNPPAYEGFRFVSREELLATSDVVSLHCPLFPSTQGLIRAETIATMKPSAFLVNTSRGPLIVDQDLADALNAGRLAGAALDVLSVEPPAESNPLITASNCIVTPHIAWATREARARLMEMTADNLRAFLAGSPINRVA
ncbi:MAG TPA: D-2-hydroxyacid dehydrogenase [Bryobacteraceae bacterium]|nr:D-2-hydroxyacid dehydrogenase [Bryobacteraceae bacterium]HPT25652.1 D-2-hydroxyacid dehydrogenase [Bryobacteraceae bacterium]